MFNSLHLFRLMFLFGALWTCQTASKEDLDFLTKEVCLNAVRSPIEKQCCPFDPNQCDEASITCQKKFERPKTESEEEQKVYVFKVIECAFMRRGFLKSENKIDMKKVKANAKKLYHGDRTQMAFMMNSYRTCSNSTARILQAAQLDSDIRKTVSSYNNPYVTMLELCVIVHTVEVCTFFHWQGQTKGNEQDCVRYAEHCRDSYFPKVKLNDWSSVEC